MAGTNDIFISDMQLPSSVASPNFNPSRASQLTVPSNQHDPMGWHDMHGAFTIYKVIFVTK